MNRHVIKSQLTNLTALALVIVGAAHALADDPVTTKSLLGEMIDLVRLGQFPDPAYKTVQYSSSDRRSTVPEGADWFANSDGFGNEPIPNFEAVLEEPTEGKPGRYLICDVQGPGAIVRTWSAAIGGTIRVELDDAETPIFDGPAAEFLQSGLQGRVVEAGLPAELYVQTYRQRDACYFPIPFGSRCRIEWTGTHKQIHFYEVQVRKYAPGTHVVALTGSAVKNLADSIEDVAQVLADPLNAWPYQSTEDLLALEAEVAPGATESLVSLTGPNAIESLTLKVSAENLDLALRQTILQITFDAHSREQVECPIGDFFGSGPGINPYNQVPFTVEPDGTMTCRFVMPFEKSCEIELKNLGEQQVRVEGMLRPLAWEWDPERSMHFRARWRVDHDLVADSGAGAQDMPFLVARGTGLYVGTAIMLLNPNPIPTPYGNWWGEGDEKIFVDDDVRPSTFGTGSEDYFNYSWSSPEIFLYPYCGQPRNDGPANRGFVVNQRWHIMDSLPFAERIAFYMELYSHERTPDFSYARLAYHYGRPGMIDDSLGLTTEDVRALEYPSNWQPAARFGARGSTFFQAEDLCQDLQQTKLLAGNRWATGKLLVWSPGSPDSKLQFHLPVPSSRKFAIHITAATGPQSARLTATLNGKPVPFGDDTINLITPHRVLLRNFTSPNLDLKQGVNTLVLSVADAARFEGDVPQIGIDFIWLQER